MNTLKPNQSLSETFTRVRVPAFSFTKDSSTARDCTRAVSPVVHCELKLGVSSDVTSVNTIITLPPSSMLCSELCGSATLISEASLAFTSTTRGPVCAASFTRVTAPTAVAAEWTSPSSRTNAKTASRDWDKICPWEVGKMLSGSTYLGTKVEVFAMLDELVVDVIVEVTLLEVNVAVVQVVDVLVYVTEDDVLVVVEVVAVTVFVAEDVLLAVVVVVVSVIVVENVVVTVLVRVEVDEVVTVEEAV